MVICGGSFGVLRRNYRAIRSGEDHWCRARISLSYRVPERAQKPGNEKFDCRKGKTRQRKAPKVCTKALPAWTFLPSKKAPKVRKPENSSFNFPLRFLRHNSRPTHKHKRSLNPSHNPGNLRKGSQRILLLSHKTKRIFSSPFSVSRLRPLALLFQFFSGILASSASPNALQQRRTERYKTNRAGKTRD